MNNYFETIFFLLSYILFFGLLLIGKAKKSNRLVGEFQLVKDHGFLIKLHIAGIFLFGIFPFLYTDIKSLQLRQLSIYAVFITIVVVCVTAIFSQHVSRKDFLKKEKYLTKKIQADNTLFRYFLIRTLFICSYELWFRGFLLNNLIAEYNVEIAITVNLFLYALLHTVNGKKEVFSCIPFGLLLCLLSITTESFIPAAIIHLSLTLTYELNFLLLVKSKTFFSYDNIRHRGYRIPG